MGLLEGEPMDFSGYDTDPMSLFAEADTTEPRGDNIALHALIARVQNGELPRMMGEEIDALDKAIEDGIITEDILRRQSDAA